MAGDDTAIVLGQLILGIEIAIGIATIIGSVWAVGRWIKCQSVKHVEAYIKDLTETIAELQKENVRYVEEANEKMRHIEERLDRIADSRTTRR